MFSFQGVSFHFSFLPFFISRFHISSLVFFSVHFFAFLYRYFGWGLSDKDPSVRLAVLRALQALVLQAAQHDAAAASRSGDGPDRGRVALMVPFVARFVPRMLEGAHDADPSCAAAAVSLLTELLLAGVLGSDEVGVSDAAVGAVDALAADPTAPAAVRAAAMRFAASRSDTLG